MLAPLKIAVVASFLGMTKQFTGNVSQVSQQINAIVMAAAGASRVLTGPEQPRRFADIPQA